MRKILFYSVISSLIIFYMASCGKRMVPSSVMGKELRSYDSAAFDYIYVEAIKQKLFGNGGEALRYLEQCLKIFPESDACYYEMAQIVLQNGDSKNGKKYAIKALSLKENNIWYLMMLAGIYYQEKSLDSAIIYYEKAVKSFPDKENLQLTLGNLYAEGNKYDKANSIFDALDKQYGVNESSTLSSARALLAEGKLDDALVKIKLLIKEYPNEILYNGLLAEIYRSKGEKEKAREVYDMLIEKNPDDPATQLSICDFLIKEKDYEELFSFLNTVILNNKIARSDKVALIATLFEEPDIISDHGDNLMLALMVLEANYQNDNIFLLFRPELLIKQGKLGDAAIRLEEIIKILPDNYYAWEKLLLVYLELKDYNKLYLKGGECATAFNRSFLAKILYANGAMETGKFSIALDELKKAEILAGNSKDSLIQVLTLRADTYYRMKDYIKAFDIFEQAIKSDKEDLTLLNNYAYYLAEQDTKLKEAEQMSKSVIEKEKGNNTYLDTYGWVLYKRGKLKEAAAIMESIIKSGAKPDAEWYDHYGFILKEQKNCEKAIQNWEIAIKLDSTKVNLKTEIENCGK